MDQALLVQKQVTNVHRWLQCRPWIPWCVPLVVATIYHLTRISLEWIIQGSEMIMPVYACSLEMVIDICILLAGATVPMYRSARIPVLWLYMLLGTLVLVTRQVAHCVYSFVHPVFSGVLCILDVCYIGVLLNQGRKCSRELRQ